MKKKSPPPKKKLPFLSRVSGAAGQRRPDRKAPPQRELRRVFNKADGDLLNPFDPPAPPGGKVTQQYPGAKPAPRPPGPRALKKGGVAKRADGGGAPGPLRAGSEMPSAGDLLGPAASAAPGTSMSQSVMEPAISLSRSAGSPPPPDDESKRKRGGAVKGK